MLLYGDWGHVPGEEEGRWAGIKEASVAVKCPETAMPQGREHILSGNLRPCEVMQRSPEYTGRSLECCSTLGSIQSTLGILSWASSAKILGASPS